MFDRLNAVFIILFDGHTQQLASIAQAYLELLEHEDYFFQAGPVLTHFLRLLRVVPNIRLLELADYFFKFFFPPTEVKDTP
jgi:hypothetical protein